MKKVIFGLVVGLLIGYQVGYRHGTNGDPSIWKQVLDKFGASRMKEEQERHDRAIDSISATQRGATPSP